MNDCTRPGAVIALLAMAMACRGDNVASTDLGRSAATALQRGISAAAAVTLPWPCAEPASFAETRAFQLEGWQINGPVLQPATARTAFIVGFIADAGGATPATEAQLRRAARAFADEQVDVVVSLGGMASDAAQIESVLRVLATGVPYPVVAIPGDLEAIGAHRAAIDVLRRQGLRVIDGSLVRWVHLGIATLATLPGARHQGQLAAGPEGCGFDDNAIEATAQQLGRADGLKILASWAAPRSGGSFDENAEVKTGVVGDWALRQAMDRHHVDLMVAGEPVKVAAEALGNGSSKERSRLLFTGFSDAEPRMPVRGRPARPSVLVLHLTRSTWRWQRMDLSMQPSP
jgi:hypothetical protein